MSVSVDVATFLEANGFGLRADGSLQIGTLKSMPDIVIAVKVSGGPPAHRTMRKLPAMPMPEVQVIVRGEKNTFGVTEARADALLAFLDNYVGMMNGTYYSQIECRHSAPLYIGVDENVRPTFSINFLAKVRSL